MWITFGHLLKTLWISSEIMYAKRKTVDNSNKMWITFGHLLKTLLITLEAVDKIRLSVDNPVNNFIIIWTLSTQRPGTLQKR